MKIDVQTKSVKTKQCVKFILGRAGRPGMIEPCKGCGTPWCEHEGLNKIVRPAGAHKFKAGVRGRPRLDALCVVCGVIRTEHWPRKSAVAGVKSEGKPKSAVAENKPEAKSVKTNKPTKSAVAEVKPEGKVGKPTKSAVVEAKLVKTNKPTKSAVADAPPAGKSVIPVSYETPTPAGVTSEEIAKLNNIAALCGVELSEEDWA